MTKKRQKDLHPLLVDTDRSIIYVPPTKLAYAWHIMEMIIKWTYTLIPLVAILSIWVIGIIGIILVACGTTWVEVLPSIFG